MNAAPGHLEAGDRCEREPSAPSTTRSAGLCPYRGYVLRLDVAGPNPDRRIVRLLVVGTLRQAADVGEADSVPRQLRQRAVGLVQTSELSRRDKRRAGVGGDVPRASPIEPGRCREPG